MSTLLWISSRSFFGDLLAAAAQCLLVVFPAHVIRVEADNIPQCGSHCMDMNSS
jgi:hypothetical protein